MRAVQLFVTWSKMVKWKEIAIFWSSGFKETMLTKLRKPNLKLQQKKNRWWLPGSWLVWACFNHVAWSHWIFLILKADGDIWLFRIAGSQNQLPIGVITPTTAVHGYPRAVKWQCVCFIFEWHCNVIAHEMHLKRKTKKVLTASERLRHNLGRNQNTMQCDYNKEDVFHKAYYVAH